MKEIFLFAAVAALFSSASAADASNAKTFPADAVKRISLETESGAITLNVSADGTVSTDVPAAAVADNCAVTEELRDGTLTLSVLSPANNRGSAGRPCAAGVAASAPAGVEIKARSGSGDVEVGAFSGKIDVRTSAGAIVLHGSSGALTLRTGSGNVTGRVGGQKIDVETGSGNVYLRGLTGSIKARSGSGAVALIWAGAPQFGVVDVRTGSGDFLATLPGEARIKISLQSGSGKKRSEFSSDASAPLSLTFVSGSGYATLKKSRRAETMKDISPDEVFDRADILRW